MQVGQNGDLANWIIPGSLVKGMGGAMDLVSSTKKVIVVMSMTDKYDQPKLVKICDLPVTGPTCVDMLITDLGVFRFNENGCVLTEISNTSSLEEIRSKTSADLIIADDIQSMEDNSSPYVGEDDEDIFA